MGLAVGDIIQAQWRGLSMNQQFILTRNYVLSGGGGNVANSVAADLADFGQSINVGGGTDLTTDFLALMPSNYQLFEIRTQRIAPERSVLVDTNAGPAAGTEGAAAVVPNDASVITFRTELAGRNQVSNIHLGPLPVDGASAGQITGPYNGLLNAFALLLLDNIAVAGFDGILKPIILHKPAMTWNLMTSFQIQPQARVMVRRTLNRGN